MSYKSMGFIGGGRITRIFLEALNRKKMLPGTVVVSDASAEVLQKLKARFPKVAISQGDNGKPAGQDVVFLALHPPAIGGSLVEIKASLKPEAVLVSLAPSFPIKALSEGLGRLRPDRPDDPECPIRRQ